MNIFDRIVSDIYEGKVSRAFNSTKPKLYPFSECFFSDNYNQDMLWFLTVRPESWFGLCERPEVWSRNYELEIPKEYRKKLLNAYHKAFAIETDRYNENVRRIINDPK